MTLITTSIHQLYREQDLLRRPTVDTGPGKTEQSHAKQTDMNLILKDYVRTGVLKHARENVGRYDDVTALDYEEAQKLVANQKSMFENFPAAIRNEFNNEVSQFLSYVQNPNNFDEVVKRGFVNGLDGLDASGVVIPDIKTNVDANLAAAAEPPEGGEPAPAS